LPSRQGQLQGQKGAAKTLQGHPLGYFDRAHRLSIKAGGQLTLSADSGSQALGQVNVTGTLGSADRLEVAEEGGGRFGLGSQDAGACTKKRNEQGSS
jgi:hypothetical protein